MDFDFCEFVCDSLILFGIVEFTDLSRRERLDIVIVCWAELVENEVKVRDWTEVDSKLLSVKAGTICASEST